jgi:hypothetical protein
MSFAFCVLSFRSSEAEWFPPAHELFEPLLADPRELQYAVRWVVPVSQKSVGEAAVGDYLGLYRWTYRNGSALQMSVGGGAFGRFDLWKRTNDMQSGDYFANLPLDFRSGSWSARFMVFHTSSHLGDDYLKETGQTVEKHAWDSLRWILSFEPTRILRLYGGYATSLRALPPHHGRNSLQGGLEIKSRWMASNHLQFYGASDYQSWERSGWRPMLNAEIGVKVANTPTSPRGLSLFLEYGAGPRPHGQFMLQRETHWNIGIRFHLT